MDDLTEQCDHWVTGPDRPIPCRLVSGHTGWHEAQLPDGSTLVWGRPGERGDWKG